MVIFAWVFAGSLIAAAGTIALLYTRDLSRARKLVLDRSMIANTTAGATEYAAKGEGIPVLVIHGAGGGFDQGLLVADELLGSGYRIVAPSRFGYLRTPAPEDTSTTAQAAAHAALLATLQIRKAVVIGISAGARSALELALHHPGRVAALILVVPGTYSPTSPVSITAGRGNAFAFWAVRNSGDFLWWAAEKLVPSVLIRFLGVRPKLVERAPEWKARAMRIVESIEPLSLRSAGINVDSAETLREPALSAVRSPTLVISARDDLFNTLPAAEFLAREIPGAQLVVYDNGGHLLLGHEQDVRERLRRFIGAATSHETP